MPKKTLWFWNTPVGPWRNWGLWWKQRVYIGVSIVNEKADWEISQRDHDIAHNLSGKTAPLTQMERNNGILLTGWLSTAEKANEKE